MDGSQIVPIRSMPFASLSNNEFSTLLKHGHGRAYLHVKEFGLSIVANIVLESCLKDPAYDRQCESCRATWLFSMFKGSKEYPMFSTAILSAMEQETDSYDVEHLCELVAQMAQSGDEVAAAALRARVLNQPFTIAETQHGCHALVVLDGVDAVVELARRYGRLLIDETGDIFTSLGYLTEGLGILSQAETRLQQLAETDDAVRAFLSNEQASASRQRDAPQLTQEERRQASRERFRSENPLDKILADAKAGVGEYPSRYMRFGTFGTTEELKNVLQRLVTEVDEKSSLRLLWVFRNASLPEIHPRIWEMTEAKNGAVRAAAIKSLSRICDARVGEFGRAKLRSKDFSEGDSEVLDIFIRNFKPGDERLIMGALRHLSPTDEQAHDLGTSILDIVKENDSRDFSEIVRWVYETNPCTLCRHQAVKWMIDAGNMMPQLISECLHDSDEDIQLAARQISSV